MPNLSYKSFELANHPPPTIPPVTTEDLKKAYDLKCSNRPLCSCSNGNVVIIASDKLVTTSKQDMLNMHLKLEKGEFYDLESYRTLKEVFYKLSGEDGFYSCSCPHGKKSVNQ
uniref:Actin-binding transcription modulator n=2 Tax=Bursaphelenchus xylophilus TaxID=6326 RepID=A0A1I7SDM8_BURXY